MLPPTAPGLVRGSHRHRRRVSTGCAERGSRYAVRRAWERSCSREVLRTYRHTYATRLGARLSRAVLGQPRRHRVTPGAVDLARPATPVAVLRGLRWGRRPARRPPCYCARGDALLRACTSPVTACSTPGTRCVTGRVVLVRGRRTDEGRRPYGAPWATSTEPLPHVASTDHAAWTLGFAAGYRSLSRLGDSGVPALTERFLRPRSTALVTRRNDMKTSMKRMKSVIAAIVVVCWPGKPARSSTSTSSRTTRPTLRARRCAGGERCRTDHHRLTGRHGGHGRRIRPRTSRTVVSRARGSSRPAAPSGTVSSRRCSARTPRASGAPTGSWRAHAIWNAGHRRLVHCRHDNGGERREPPRQPVQRPPAGHPNVPDGDVGPQSPIELCRCRRTGPPSPPLRPGISPCAVSRTGHVRRDSARTVTRSRSSATPTSSSPSTRSRSPTPPASPRRTTACSISISGSTRRSGPSISPRRATARGTAHHARGLHRRPDLGDKRARFIPALRSEMLDGAEEPCSGPASVGFRQGRVPGHPHRGGRARMPRLCRCEPLRQPRASIGL